jgi:hypothetical protein
MEIAEQIGSEPEANPGFMTVRDGLQAGAFHFFELREALREQAFVAAAHRVVRDERRVDERIVIRDEFGGLAIDQVGVLDRADAECNRAADAA